MGGPKKSMLLTQNLPSGSTSKQRWHTAPSGRRSHTSVALYRLSTSDVAYMSACKWVSVNSPQRAESTEPCVHYR